jgi:hypothetical protein
VRARARPRAAGPGRCRRRSPASAVVSDRRDIGQPDLDQARQATRRRLGEPGRARRDGPPSATWRRRWARSRPAAWARSRGNPATAIAASVVGDQRTCHTVVTARRRRRHGRPPGVQDPARREPLQRDLAPAVQLSEGSAQGRGAAWARAGAGRPAAGSPPVQPSPVPRR